jgi:hypothetical protein
MWQPPPAVDDAVRSERVVVERRCRAPVVATRGPDIRDDDGILPAERHRTPAAATLGTDADRGAEGPKF